MPARFRSPPPDSEQDRPGDRLAVIHAAVPAEPWVAEARAEVARLHAAPLHLVPAFVPDPPSPASATPPCPTTRGIHRPRTTSRTWAAVAFVAALLAVALILEASR